MLLAQIIDFTRWEAALTHPPPLGRTFALLQYANGAFGDDGVKGLQLLDNDLKPLDGEVMDRANHMIEAVASNTRTAIGATNADGALPDERRKQILRDLAVSPIGVLLAFEDAREPGAAALRSHLPEDMQKFLDLDLTARTDRLMGRTTTDGTSWK